MNEVLGHDIAPIFIVFFGSLAVMMPLLLGELISNVKTCLFSVTEVI
jgi:hypothetical protein